MSDAPKVKNRGTAMLLSLLTMAIAALLQAWPIMIGAGILHLHWAVIPDFTYWESFWLTWAWGVVWVSMGRTVEFRESE